jgi:hypothetical protein
MLQVIHLGAERRPDVVPVYDASIPQPVVRFVPARQKRQVSRLVGGIWLNDEKGDG